MSFVVEVCPEISAALQELAFKHGFEWNNDLGKTVQYQDAKFLFFHDDGKIQFSNRLTDANKFTAVDINDAVKRIKTHKQEYDWTYVRNNPGIYVPKNSDEKLVVVSNTNSTWNILRLIDGQLVFTYGWENHTFTKFDGQIEITGESNENSNKS